MLRALVSLVVVGLLAGQAASQDLDGVWFKVKVKAKGVTASNIILLDSAEGEPTIEVKKASFKTTAYILFMFIEDEGLGSGGTYVTATVTPDGEGGWEFADEDEFQIVSDELLVNGFLGFVTEDGAVGGSCTLVMKNKFDKEGALKSSKLTSFGGTVFESSLFTDAGPVLAEGGPGILPYFGEISVKGKSVPDTKLPFDPEEVLMGGGMVKSLQANGKPRRGFDVAPQLVADENAAH